MKNEIDLKELHGEMIITTKQKPNGEIFHCVSYDFDLALLPPTPKAPDGLMLKSDDPQKFNAISAEINTGRIDRTELEQNLDRMRTAFKTHTQKP